MKSGIYIITCLVNNKIYIGRSKNWKGRLHTHKSHLINNRHPNPYLQSAANKYGIENFTFELLEEYDIEFLCSMEHYWCNLLCSYNREFGYNIEPTNPNCYKCHSKETGEKISKSNMGKKHTKESKKKISDSNKGKILSNEHRKKLSVSKKGIKFTKEHKRNLSIAHTGKIVSKETKKKQSISHSLNHPTIRAVKCIEDDLIFPSITKTAIHYNVSYGCIAGFLYGYNKSNKLNKTFIFL